MYSRSFKSPNCIPNHQPSQYLLLALYICVCRCRLMRSWIKLYYIVIIVFQQKARSCHFKFWIGYEDLQEFIMIGRNSYKSLIPHCCLIDICNYLAASALLLSSLFSINKCIAHYQWSNVAQIVDHIPVTYFNLCPLNLYPSNFAPPWVQLPLHFVL